MKSPVKRTMNYYYFYVLINPSGNCKKKHKKWHSFPSPSSTDLRHFGRTVQESFGLDSQEALVHTNPACMCYWYPFHSTPNSNPTDTFVSSRQTPDLQAHLTTARVHVPLSSYALHSCQSMVGFILLYVSSF